jgi:hypothetical protein
MAPPPLFHVAAHALPAGEAVRPYTIGWEYSDLLQLAKQALGAGPDATAGLLAGEAWGYVRRYGGDRAAMVLMEAAFERARLLTAPRLPSRLHSVYAWGSLALAERFRAGYRSAGVIHRCALVAGTIVERDAALVVAAFESADLAEASVEDLRRVEEFAIQYWQGSAPMAWPEVLVNGTVVVEAVVDPTDAARSTEWQTGPALISRPSS